MLATGAGERRAGGAAATTRWPVALLGSTGSCLAADRDSRPGLAARSALGSASAPTDDGASTGSAGRAVRSKASNSRENGLRFVASAATPHPADRVFACGSRLCGFLPDDPPDKRSPVPPSTPETSASIRWLRSRPGPGPAAPHRICALCRLHVSGSSLSPPLVRYLASRSSVAPCVNQRL